MRLALLMMAAVTAMASASALTPAPACTKLENQTTANLTQQDAAEHLQTRAPQHAAAIQTVALEPATGQADKEDSGWQAFAPVVATLALIGAIAVRRHRAGRS